MPRAPGSIYSSSAGAAAPDDVFVAIGLFFSKLAVVTYGVAVRGDVFALFVEKIGGATTPLVDATTPVTVSAAGVAALILFRHRANIVRIAMGTERRIGQKA
mgnify:CR=1 FL=1